MMFAFGDGKGGLGQIGDSVGIGYLHGIGLLDAAHQFDRLGRLAERAHHFVVARMTYQDDRIALGGEPDGLAVDFSDQRAGSVNRPQLTFGRQSPDTRRDTVGGKDQT